MEDNYHIEVISSPDEAWRRLTSLDFYKNQEQALQDLRELRSKADRGVRAYRLIVQRVKTEVVC